MKPTVHPTHTAAKVSQKGHMGTKMSVGSTPVLKENPKPVTHAPTSHHGTSAPKFSTNGDGQKC